MVPTVIPFFKDNFNVKKIACGDNHSLVLVKKSKKKKDNKPEEPDFATTLNKQMLFMMPILVTIFAYSLPATMSLYWITTTLFTIGQEFFLIKQVDKAEGIK